MNARYNGAETGQNLCVRSLSVLLLSVLLGLGASAGAVQAATPPIGHVFVIVLENEDAGTTFTAGSPAPYLRDTLRAQGAFLPNYYGIGHASLDNYLAMISGQAPNPQTQSDCQVFTDVMPGLPAADGQTLGTGCAYPASVPTIAGQLQQSGRSWKGYMEDMGADPSREDAACAHPATGSPDATQKATATDQYATRHNPFVYFHAITDDGAACRARDVPLTQLGDDLATASTTPALSFVTPDLCHDGHDASCADGGPGGLVAADGFLRTWVPRILAAPAFRDGLLIVTFDEAGSDASACCGEVPGPNTPLAGGSPPGPGGGRVGAVALSPYITPGTVTDQPYNHYALLRSLEDLWALPHLGYAAAAGLQPFAADVFTRPAGTTSPQPAIGATGVTGAVGGSGGGGTNPGGSPPGCRPRTLRHAPRHLPPGTLLSTLSIDRVTGGRRILVATTAHSATLRIRVGGRALRRHVRACRTYRVGVPRRGAVRVVALSGRHSERRTAR